jgi:hypothetical protein
MHAVNHHIVLISATIMWIMLVRFIRRLRGRGDSEDDGGGRREPPPRREIRERRGRRRGRQGGGDE